MADVAGRGQNPLSSYRAGSLQNVSEDEHFSVRNEPNCALQALAITTTLSELIAATSI